MMGLFSKKKKQFILEFSRTDIKFNTSEKYTILQEQIGDQLLLSIQKTEGVGNGIVVKISAK